MSTVTKKLKTKTNNLFHIQKQKLYFILHWVPEVLEDFFKLTIIAIIFVLNIALYFI